MAMAITLDGVRIDGRGRVRFKFGDKELEFRSLADAQEFVSTSVTDRDLIAAAVGVVITRQPALGNPSVFAGLTVTVDFTKASWGVIG